MENLEQVIADTLLERPLGFSIKSKHFYVYPQTLGKVYLNGALIKQLDIDNDNMQNRYDMELLRLFADKNDTCIRLIAVNTFEGKDCLDNVKVEKRMRELKSVLTAEDGTVLLANILSGVDTDDLQKELGITDELTKMKKAQDAKSDSSTLTFCGKSVWGTMISSLAKEYGWTLQYILWGISVANIQMLMADSVKTLYMSDDEIKKANIIDNNKILDGNDPATWEKLKNFRWD